MIFALRETRVRLSNLRSTCTDVCHYQGASRGLLEARRANARLLCSPDIGQRLPMVERERRNDVNRTEPCSGLWVAGPLRFLPKKCLESAARSALRP
jgi:hypothetical protein